MIAGLKQNGCVVLYELNVGRLYRQRTRHEALGLLKISRLCLGDAQKMKRVIVFLIFLYDLAIEFGCFGEIAPPCVGNRQPASSSHFELLPLGESLGVRQAKKLTNVPAAPLLASRSSALPPVCRAIAELLGMPEEGAADALPDEPDGPLELPVPADAAAAAELEDVEGGVGEN